MKDINILLIHADQHRKDCLGAYGNTEIITPHIDALAGDGVKYEDSYCVFPICTPSRYSMLSGMYAHQHLSVTNRSTLPEGVPTFVKELRKSGFHTAAVGKMHFTPTYLDVGFDTMCLAEQDGEGRYDDDYHRHLMENQLADVFDWWDECPQYRKNAPQSYWESYNATVSELPCEEHSTSWIGKEALKEIDTWESGGNMLMVGFIKPHFPFDPPKPWSDLYDPEKLTLLPGWTEYTLPMDRAVNPGRFDFAEMTESKMRQIQAYYYANISHVDSEVGKIISLLKQKGLYDKTMIIYTSDHGDYMGYHHMVGKKNHFYDPVIKIPLIIKYPYQTQHGVVNTAVNSNIDLAPTILRQVALPVPPTMKGQDLNGDYKSNEFVVCQLVCDEADGFMIRTKKYKLMLYKQKEYNAFFDLERDPYELKNVISQPDYAEIVEKMTKQLMDFVLFDFPATALVDLGAKQCQEENVPKDIPANRERIREYYEKKMADQEIQER